MLPAKISSNVSTLLSKLSLKSQLFIPDSGRDNNSIGTSTVSPGLPSTEAIFNFNVLF